MIQASTQPLSATSHVRTWRCTSPVRGAATAHRGLELAWLDAGAARYGGPGGEVVASPGAFVVVPPGVEHVTALDEGLRGTVVELDASVVREVASATSMASSRFDRVVAVPDEGGIVALGGLLAREAGSGARDQALVVDALVEALVVKLLRLDVWEARPVHARDPRLLAAIDYAHTHACDPSLDVARLAAAAGMSRYHFSRAFRGALGVAPHAFVLDLRARHAASLLRRGRRSVTEAAFASGFGDLGRFRVAFRRTFGVGPSEYVAATRAG
jgi:AraC-like DNA-binding protein